MSTEANPPEAASILRDVRDAVGATAKRRIVESCPLPLGVLLDEAALHGRLRDLRPVYPVEVWNFEMMRSVEAGEIALEDAEFIPERRS